MIRITETEKGIKNINYSKSKYEISVWCLYLFDVHTEITAEQVKNVLKLVYQLLPTQTNALLPAYETALTIMQMPSIRLW